MRTLRLNKKEFWKVSPIGYEEIMDGTLYTGEKRATFSEPIKIKMNVNPASGLIVSDIEGRTVKAKMMAVSEKDILNAQDLLFVSEPSGNYDTTYDYRVVEILPSLNFFRYGLEMRANATIV